MPCTPLAVIKCLEHIGVHSRGGPGCGMEGVVCSVVNRSDSFYDAGGGAPGALQRTSAGVHPVELHGTAHCRDMFSPDAFAELKPPRGPIADTPAVQWAHAAISAAVARYVS